MDIIYWEGGELEAVAKEKCHITPRIVGQIIMPHYSHI